jgi:uncharacterized membrane protein (UPF0127 family)
VSWIVRGDDVLAAAEVAVSHRLRSKGLVGREDFEGALILRPCRQVHTVGMKFPIDVAFCDRYGFVLHRSTLVPRRVSRLVWRSYFAIEARAGSFERWKLEPGDVIEVRG